MKNIVSGAVGLLLLGALAQGQEPARKGNAPEFVKIAKAPGLQVNFVDFTWDEAAFKALQDGADHPAARRSWVLARLMLQTPFRWNGKAIPVGSALLVLNPAKGGAGPTLHIQYVDMREIFVDMNVIAEPPEGYIYGTVPAGFTRVEGVAPRLVLTVDAKGDDVEIGVQYGDRHTSVTLTRI
jgi:hypothetical protein